MILETLEGQAGVRLDLGASLDLQAVGELIAVLRDAAAQPGPLLIDASAVERMSTGAIQALLAGCRAVTASGGETTLTDPSTAFIAAFNDCGVKSSGMGWTVTMGKTDG